jgi:hypothetical protein
MATTIGDNYPYFELQFNKDGSPDTQNGLPAIISALQEALENGHVTDLFAVSHGWNNDMAEARSLYNDLFAQVKGVIGQTTFGRQARKPAVLGILWPSKKFDDQALIPGDGGALGLGAAHADLARKIEQLQGVFSAHDADRKLAEAKALLPSLEANPVARLRFGVLMQDIMRGAIVEQPNSVQNEDNASSALAMQGDELLAAVSSPPPAVGPGVGTAGQAASVASGHATSLGGLFNGIVDGVRNLLNFTTYYEMKNRAGVVGRGGVYRSLAEVRRQLPALPVHLAGHSFGGRVVTAAADGPTDGAPIRPASLTLLQAAYSHYGMASRWDGVHDGLFRAVITSQRVDGPILVTYTKNDKAVGIAYAIASRLAHQVAAAIGGPDDKYGGLGRNGAQKTPEAVAIALGASGTSYQFQPNRVYNLNADQVIMGHSDIRKPEVAYALLSAAAP